MKKTIYFQARINDVHVASGFCESIESLQGDYNEVRFWNGSNFIAIRGIGLEVKYHTIHPFECIVEDGIVLQNGEKIN